MTKYLARLFVFSLILLAVMVKMGIQYPDYLLAFFSLVVAALVHVIWIIRNKQMPQEDSEFNKPITLNLKDDEKKRE